MPPVTAGTVTTTAVAAAERLATSPSPSSPRTRLLPRLHLLCRQRPASVNVATAFTATAAVAAATDASLRLRKPLHRPHPPMSPSPPQSRPLQAGRRYHCRCHRSPTPATAIAHRRHRPDIAAMPSAAVASQRRHQPP
uniref:Uncharacterized protein n=1 Tax=Oryza sativa subsp. japonica TaxID=39947 RepID=Q6ES09_ORYSJ|nr:hypothetical protein [Oryza sativa Japonica Group]BAD28561.1 hypothetical protein [Oryza sativa Japonica Group]